MSNAAKIDPNRLLSFAPVCGATQMQKIRSSRMLIAIISTVRATES